MSEDLSKLKKAELIEKIRLTNYALSTIRESEIERYWGLRCDAINRAEAAEKKLEENREELEAHRERVKKIRQAIRTAAALICPEIELEPDDDEFAVLSSESESDDAKLLRHLFGLCLFGRGV